MKKRTSLLFPFLCRKGTNKFLFCYFCQSCILPLKFSISGWKPLSVSSNVQMYQILNNKFHVCIANSTSPNLSLSESSRNLFWHLLKGKFFQSHTTHWNVFIEEKLIFDDIWKEVGKEDYFKHPIINLSSLVFQPLHTIFAFYALWA